MPCSCGNVFFAGFCASAAQTAISAKSEHSLDIRTQEIEQREEDHPDRLMPLRSRSTAHVAPASAHTSKSKHKQARKPLTAKQLARSQKLHQAFVASSQLRPMAQQLASTRSPAAYAGFHLTPMPIRARQRQRLIWRWGMRICWIINIRKQ